MGAIDRTSYSYALEFVRVELKMLYLKLFMKQDIIEQHPLGGLTVRENVGVKGIHIISVCDIITNRAKLLQEALENCRLRRERIITAGRGTAGELHRLWEEYTGLLKELHKGFLANQITVENLTVTVGRSVLMQRLAGTVTYTGTVNYGALGTNSTAPAVSDTQLGTETYRKALSSGTYLSNVAYLENFYTASEVTGTFQEYGFFIDGTASANTGQMWNRFVSTVAKTSVQSLNVQSIITLASA